MAFAFNEIGIKKFDFFADFDSVGDTQYLYLNLDNGTIYIWNDTTRIYDVLLSGSGGGSDPLKEDKINKGAANGYAPLNSGSLIDQIYLPSYVDDIIEGIWINSTTFNVSGSPVVLETGKIYVSTDTGKQYRYSGSLLIQITNGLIASTNDVPEGSSLYFTTARVLATMLSGLSLSTAQVIASTDTILQALGYLQAQITALNTIYQVILVSGTNIKTINGSSVLGSGNLTVSGKVGVTAGYTTGQYYSAELNGAAGTTQALANNDFRGSPHKFQEAFSFDRIRFSVSATGTATLAKIYIFDSNADETPKNTPIYTSADIAIGTIGLKDPGAVSITFNANEIYWVCVQVNGTVTLDVKAAVACYNLGDSNNTQSFVGVRNILGSYAAVTNFTTNVGAYLSVRSLNLPPKISFRKS